MFGCRPTVGGKYCLGERKRFRSCNIDVSIAAVPRHCYRQCAVCVINWLNLFCAVATWDPAGTGLLCVCVHFINIYNDFVWILHMCVGYRSALLALGISGRFSALTLTAFRSGESFTPGNHTEGVSVCVNLLSPWWSLQQVASLTLTSLGTIC